jgi:hypothetical protein
MTRSNKLLITGAGFALRKLGFLQTTVGIHLLDYGGSTAMRSLPVPNVARPRVGPGAAKMN